MKKLLFIITAFAVLVTSCKKDDNQIPENKSFIVTEVNINGDLFQKIEGVINENFTLDSSKKWLLSGGVFIEEGYSLYINGGQTIYADPSVTTFLSIKQGAKIFAEGSSTNPIIFTPLKSNPTYGDWGGIIVNGYADINTGLTAEGEGGTGVYGGSNDQDNSGILKYIRVEYAGKILGTDNELNGFSFNGVGSSTIVEYIQAYRGSDDGIELFGGTLNIRYAVSTENQDDSFDWTHGWRGKGQYWFVQQGIDGGDRGIEADNNGDDNTASPYSEPTLSNITLNGVNDGDGLNEGIRLREGTKGKIFYANVTGFAKYGVRVSEQTTLNHITTGELFVANSIISGNGTDFKDCNSFAGLTATLNDSWFIQDSNVGSGNAWMNGWTK
jgi:hypothetical protein